MAMGVGLGAMMAGGNAADGRVEDDFYATPPEATKSILTAYGPFLWHPEYIHEPCCGDGAMSKIILEHFKGVNVISTDLIDRGYGAVKDIYSIPRTPATVVITNPPFSEAEGIIRHVLGVWKADVLMLLLKSTFFHAADRAEGLFNEFRPSSIWALPWRLDFHNKGRPTMECSWFVWDKNNPTADGFPSYRIAPNMNPRKRGKNEVQNVE